MKPKQSLLTLLLISITTAIWAQTDSISDAPIQEEVVYEQYVLDNDVMFIGPERTIKNYITKNTRYPEIL
jgi:hypothetical protein